MQILLFDKSPEICRQIERTIKSIVDKLSVSEVDNINALLDTAADSVYHMIIIDGDSLEGKFKALVDIVKKSGANTYIFIFFSFNIKIIMDKFIDYGANYCFDKLSGFDSFIEAFKLTYSKTTRNTDAL